MMKNEGREKRLMTYVWTGASIGAVLLAFSGEPEFLIALVTGGVLFAALAIIKNQTWFRKAEIQARGGRTAKLTAIRIAVSVGLVFTLVMLLQLVATLLKH